MSEKKPAGHVAVPETVRLRLHPDSLMNEPYGEETLDLSGYRAPAGPWAPAPAAEKALCFRAADGTGIEVTRPGRRLLRVRWQPGGGAFGPSLTEKLGLVNAAQPGAETPAGGKNGRLLTASSGPFLFSLAPDGAFSIAAAGRTIIENSGGARFSRQRAAWSGHRFFSAFRLPPEEKIWGFGGRVQPLDRRGSTVDIFSMKVGRTAGDYGGFPMPFFISSAGYGLFLNNPWPHVYFDMGRTSPENWFVTAPGGAFDLFLIHGPRVRDIVRAFTALTGRIPPPEKALFGFWVSSLAFETAGQMLAVVERFRDEGWPADNFVLDGPWRGGPEFLPNYSRHGEYMNNDLDWHPDFGDGPAMVRAIHERGGKVVLHLNSRIFTRETADAALDRGLLRRHEKEEVVKLEDPAGEQFFLAHLEPRIRDGVDYWWTDHTDRVSGEIRPGVPSRNLFGPLWNRLLARAMAAAGRGPRLSLSRGGGIGSQASALPWPGDTAAGLDRFAEDIWFCLSAGLAGFPVTSVDMGGFTCPRPGMSEAENEAVSFGPDNLHRRLFQSIMFIPAPRIHNNSTEKPRLPWLCPEASRPLYRAFLRERYRLTPYYYSLGLAAAAHGDPVLRPLFYVFDDDPATHGIDDVFLAGEHLLFAPVLEAGARERRFYLPAGRWYDYWTGREISGGREISRPCPIDQLAGLPLLVREGFILPRQPDCLWLEEAAPARLDLLIFPDAGGRASLELREGPVLKHAFSCQVGPGGAGRLCLENQAARPREYRVSFVDQRLFRRPGDAGGPGSAALTFSLAAGESRTWDLEPA